MFGNNSAEHEAAQQMADLGNARQASQDPVQAARDGGLLSFGLLLAAWRS
jgi:hypothetical protein